MLSQEALQSILSSESWIPLGKGTYNEALISSQSLNINGYCGRWVLKIPEHKSLYNSVERAVRKWKIHNPGLPVYSLKESWLVPYLGNIEATDKQIAEKLLDIYQRSGEVIADACGTNNFLMFQNQVVCIDMDLSLRRRSFASEDYLKKVVSTNIFETYLNTYEFSSPRLKPKAVTYIRTLLYLEDQIPNYALHQHVTSKIMAWLNMFRLEREPLSDDVMDMLFDIEKLDSNHKIPDVCFNLSFFRVALQAKQEGPLTLEQLLKYAYQSLWSVATWTHDLDKARMFHIIKALVEENPSALNTVGDNGYTLLHLAVVYSHRDLVVNMIRLDETLETKTSSQCVYPSMTALDIAFHTNIYLAYELIYRGAKVSPHWITMLQESQQPNTNCNFSPSDALRHLYMSLVTLAKEADKLSNARKLQLIEFVKRYPNLLSCIIDLESEFTLLFMLFSTNQVECIEALSQLPSWKTLIQTKHPTSGWTLYHVISKYGHAPLSRYLQDVDIHAVTHRSKSLALHLAAHVNNYDLCHEMLLKGANPFHRNVRAKKAESFWSDKTGPNPFIDFFDDLILLASKPHELDSSKKEKLTKLIKQNSDLLTSSFEDGKPLIHLAFETDQAKLIQEIALHPNWPDILTTINENTDANLFHVITLAGHDKYYHLLKHLCSNHTERCIALQVSAEIGNEALCKALLEDNADPNLRNSHGHTAEALWSGDKKNNPFQQLRDELIALATDTDALDEAQKAALLERIKQHTHFLIWPLINDETFLHLIFKENNTRLIQEVMQLPNWFMFSYTHDASKHYSLFDTIASTGRTEYFESLKHLINSQSLKNRALRYAAEYGHTDFCHLLMQNGADPNYKCILTGTAETLWCKHHPHKPNIFNPYCRKQNLSELKQCLLQHIDSKLAKVNSFGFFSEMFWPNKATSTLTELKVVILDAEFQPSDASDYTACDLLTNTIHQWKSDNQDIFKPSQSQLVLFAWISPDDGAVTGVLNHIEALIAARQLSSHMRDKAEEMRQSASTF